MKKVLLMVVMVLFVAGCAGMKETTTTTQTQGVTVPPVYVHDTVEKPVYLPPTSAHDDSVGQWYLANFCKGTVTVDQNGLRATLNFQMTVNDKLQNENKSLQTTKALQSAMILKLTAELEQKAKKIPVTITKTETISTPDDWWIFWHSLKFTIPAFIVGAIGALVALSLLKSKLGAVMKLFSA